MFEVGDLVRLVTSPRYPDNRNLALIVKVVWESPIPHARPRRVASYRAALVGHEGIHVIYSWEVERI